MPVTLIAAFLAIWGIFIAGVNAILSFINHFGYPALALFLMGILYLDIGLGTNAFGTVISFGTNQFFGFAMSSLTLFIFVFMSLIIWFFVKVRQFHTSGAYSR